MGSDDQLPGGQRLGEIDELGLAFAFVDEDTSPYAGYDVIRVPESGVPEDPDERSDGEDEVDDDRAAEQPETD